MKLHVTEYNVCGDPNEGYVIISTVDGGELVIPDFAWSDDEQLAEVARGWFLVPPDMGIEVGEYSDKAKVLSVVTSGFPCPMGKFTIMQEEEKEEEKVCCTKES